MDLNGFVQGAIVTLVAVGWKVAGAAALWLVGRWLITFALRGLKRVLLRQEFDATLSRYLVTTLKAVLNVVLVVAILGFFGVETTTFAALAGRRRRRDRRGVGRACSPTSRPARSWCFSARSRSATS